MHDQDQNKKNITKNFDAFHNHSPLAINYGLIRRKNSEVTEPTIFSCLNMILNIMTIRVPIVNSYDLNCCFLILILNHF